MNIKDLVKRKESQGLEFKESLRLKDEIGRAVSAFSNSKGGIILVGVTDAGKVIGVSIGKNTLEKLANYIKRNTDPPIFPSVRVEDVDKKKIIVIKVKESDDKPVFFKKHTYKRVGKSDQELSSSEIRKLAKEEKERLNWDERVCEEASLEDIDEEKVRWFLRKAKSERKLEIDSGIPINEALERLNLVKNDELTNAAILLFGKNPQRFFLQAKVKCARFKGTKPLEFIDMKVFNGNVIEQRSDALEFVKEHIKLHAEIKGTERVEKWEYPIEAIREAITNAICHRDYRIASNVQVRIFDDRIEVWGVGPLPEPLTPEDLKKKHDSILRNPLIGNCFFLIKFIEEWGTGTNRMIEWCLKHGLPEPIFEEITGSLVVTFRKYHITEEILRTLNDRQKKAVDYIKKKGRITNKEYQKLCPNVTRETLRKDLNELIKKKIIVRRGVKRGVFYEFL